MSLTKLNLEDYLCVKLNDLISNFPNVFVIKSNSNLKYNFVEFIVFSINKHLELNHWGAYQNQMWFII